MHRSSESTERVWTPEGPWRAFENPEVAAVVERYPEPIRTKMLLLRQLIFDTARATAGVGELEETLRWGEASYLTKQSGSGTTIRIASKEPTKYALYVHCQTDLIARFKSLYPDEFEYGGTRSIRLNAQDDLPDGELRHCIALALRYHLDKKKRKRQAATKLRLAARV